jgi:hypothetical protein
MHYRDRAEIINIARRHCDNAGWPWVEPIFVHEGLFSTSVHTNAEHRGGNAYVRISERTGHIERAFFSHR